MMERRAFLKFVGAAALLAPMTKYLGWSPMPAQAMPEVPLVPVGSIFPYAGSAAPEGWLVCDGQAVSALRYPQLYKAIGDNFGSEGRRFKVPDMRVKPYMETLHPDGPPTRTPYLPPSYLIRVA